MKFTSEAKALNYSTEKYQMTPFHPMMANAFFWIRPSRRLLTAHLALQGWRVGTFERSAVIALSIGSPRRINGRLRLHSTHSLFLVDEQ
jgi:hypothetical protein